MSQENKTLILRIYEEFDQRNYAAVLDLFDPNFEWVAADHSPLANGSPYRGKEAVRDLVFARIAAGFERLNIRVDELFEAGEKVVMLGYYDGQRRSNGKQFQAQVAHVWTVSSGKALKFQQYVDTYQLAQTML